MRTLIASLLLLSAFGLQPSVFLHAAPDAQLTAIIEENRGTSSKLITYADQKAAALAAAQAEAAQLRSQLSAVSAQLSAEQAARAKAQGDLNAAIAERDTARRAVADAKAQIEATLAKL